jgi:hypothetical protein
MVSAAPTRSRSVKIITLDNGCEVSDYEGNARERGRDAANDSHGHGRRIMSEEVTDHGLLDLSGLSLDTPLEESALAKALTRVLAVSEDGPSNSFSASI